MPFFPERIQRSVDNWPIPGLGQEKHKISMKCLFVPKSRGALIKELGVGDRQKAGSSSFFLFSIYLFISRGRGREGEREGEKHQCVVVSPASPTRDPAGNPGMCPDQELNR